MKEQHSKLMISEIDYLKESWSWELNDSFEMTSLPVSSRKRVYWTCSQCDYTYQRSISVQHQNQGQCPRCQQLKKNKETSLEVVYPSLSACLITELNKGWTGAHVTPFSHRMLWWQCPDCRESYSMSVAQRVKSTHCPYCTGRRVSVKNSLATLNPIAAAQWDTVLNHGLTPAQVTANSNKEFWFRCDICQHAWLARCNTRTSSKTDCPECAKRRLKNRVRQRHLRPCSNHLGVTHPHLAQEWHPILNKGLPLTAIRSKSNRMVWWRCSHCGHDWQAKVVTRTQTQKGQKCPNCQRGML